eukprot:162988-Pyramimonas_sp.AAC.1
MLCEPGGAEAPDPGRDVSPSRTLSGRWGSSPPSRPRWRPLDTFVYEGHVVQASGRYLICRRCAAH